MVASPPETGVTGGFRAHLRYLKEDHCDGIMLSDVTGSCIDYPSFTLLLLAQVGSSSSYLGE